MVKCFFLIRQILFFYVLINDEKIFVLNKSFYLEIWKLLPLNLSSSHKNDFINLNNIIII
jgi:hypothetical protein